MSRIIWLSVYGNAIATFNRLAFKPLKGLEVFCGAYLDDKIIMHARLVQCIKELVGVQMQNV
jgi:hypothetical protein